MVDKPKVKTQSVTWVGEMRKVQEDAEGKAACQAGCREGMRKVNSYTMVKVPL